MTRSSKRTAGRSRIAGSAALRRSRAAALSAGRAAWPRAGAAPADEDIMTGPSHDTCAGQHRRPELGGQSGPVTGRVAVVELGELGPLDVEVEVVLPGLSLIHISE